MVDRAQNWLLQAHRDLEQAEDSQKLGRHEWACFAAQQAAEKAVNALYLRLKQEAWGHVVVNSDLDLILIVEASQVPFWERALE